MQSTQHNPVLSTKLYIPRARPSLVPRPRLIEQLNESLRCPITLVCAPAGYGKTTLLSEWIPQYENCVTWLSLDEGDNDPVRFWRHFLAALRTLNPELCRDAQLSLEASQVPEVETVLSLVINDLAALEYRFVHVFDDYHLVDNLAIDKGLTFLVEHLPPNVNLIVASRRDPALPLARWRAQHHLAEIRSADLRFRAEEAATFYNQVMELELSDQEVAALESRTEGWISGLQLAALSLKDRGDRSRFIAEFAGSHRFIIDYLAEEVLSRQAQPVREFLLATSIPNRLCGSLCNALTGNDDGQSMLEQLEQANLFIEPLDNDRAWYRYHPLFQEVLRSRLRATREDRVPDLHVRAADWFEAEGLIVEAIHHALAAEARERSVRMIVDVADNIAFTQGQFTTVLNWLESLPENVLQSHPRLILIRAWILLNAGSGEAVEENLLVAERALPAQEPAQRLELRGEVAAVRAMIASYRREISRTIELCRQARQLLPESNLFLQAAVTSALGLAYRFSGRAVEASEAFSEAIALSQAAGNYYIMMDSVANLARMQMLRGQRNASEQTCRQALQFAEEQARAKGHPLLDAGFPHIRLGEALREKNELDLAEQFILKGIEMGKLGGNLDIVISGYGFLLSVRQAQGDLAGARAARQRIEELAVSFKNKIMLLEWGVRLARLALVQGDLSTAEEWARQYELFTGRDPAYNEEFAGITLARLRLAQSRFSEAIELLAQLQEEAEAAERMGSAIEILTLEALASAAQANHPRAFSSLEQALTLAEPEGYMRIFIDEGEPMRLLLCDYKSHIKRQIGKGVSTDLLRILTYVDRLLAVFPQTVDARKSRDGAILAEPLSERELEILRLIATGRSNHEIADTLVIALSTVKSHINNLYGKLGTNRRTEAIAIARDLGLLSE
ncbi:MAG TPA: LuxR C-terminal-related transcriptional regulator [Anaerolineales bacterium]|nr:LuxR C-terminal-related transcriptional regulator [Anaerolineales bacterium]